MTEHDDPDVVAAEHRVIARVDHRARAAATSIRRAADIKAPELHRLVSVSRKMWLVALAASLAVMAAIGAVILGLASVAGTVPLAALTGAVLAVLLILTWILCAHAGGHAWLVPVPACALAVAWALTAASGQWSSTSAWWLVAASAAMCAGAVVVAGTALRQAVGGVRAALPPLRGADGTAITSLGPTGVVQVGGETWTAESISGPLPAGAPVHVVRVRGLRLLVWSEVGAVQGTAALDSEEGFQ